MTHNINSMRDFFGHDAVLFPESIFRLRRSTSAEVLSGPFRLATQADIPKTTRVSPTTEEESTIEFVKVAIFKTKDGFSQQAIDRINDFNENNKDTLVIAASNNTSKKDKILCDILDKLLKARDDARGNDGRLSPLILSEAEEATLTQRQKNILSRIAAGDTNKKIALDTGLCENTIKVHVRNILNRLGAKNRKEAACRAEFILRD